MGAAIFALVITVFFAVQSIVFMVGLQERDPELFEGGLSLNTLQGADAQRLEAWMLNGDLVAREAFWAGLLGIAVLLFAVWRWKGANTRIFLGLMGAKPRAWLRWAAIFAALLVFIEVMARLSPMFRTDFMARVIGSTTEHWYLVLGVGIMAPVFEEFLLRGHLLGSLRHLMDEHAAVAVSAGVFTLMHLQYSWAIMLLVLPMGVALGYARTRSGSLAVPIVLHMVNNLASIALG